MREKKKRLFVKDNEQTEQARNKRAGERSC